MVDCDVRPVLDPRGRELGTVALTIRVPPNPVARAHVAELLADAERPSYVRPRAEWVADGSVAPPYTAEVLLTLDGPPATPYADASYRVQLSFTDCYPARPPVVRFASILYHAQVEEGGLLEPVFYERLEWATRKGRSSRHVRAVVALLRTMLVEPLPGGPPLHPRVRQRIELLQQRRTRVINAYAPLHAELFDADALSPLSPKWFHAPLLAALRGADPGAARALLREECAGVYSFELATPAFCQAFMAEMAHFEASGLPSSRPNSMNKYGVIVNEMGLEPLVDALQAQLLRPLGRLLYAHAPGCRSLDHHHAFSVQYAARAPGVSSDQGLDMHHDDSELTLNLCVGKSFSGAQLTICGVFGQPSYRQLQYK